ncbi:TrbC/VirB2 family protein [Aliivibrio salmonicida]|uniref:TrbC/VirB2 family protein n=1 Tax=Aliivibrio salmonicida TaxID=40269 RepID=UPI003D107C11
MNTSVSSASSRLSFGVLRLSLALFSLFPVLAHAEGLDKVNDFMENVAAVLRGASIVTVTVALMWCGYKYLFTEWDIREMGRILMGALLVGGAAELARYFIL